MSGFGCKVPCEGKLNDNRIRNEDEEEDDDNVGCLKNSGSELYVSGGYHGHHRQGAEYADSEVDARTQSTAYEALLSKYSACNLDYFRDNYLKAIVATQHFRGYQRKPPIINRGYYTRVKSIQFVIESFLRETGSTDRQIVSLGGGLDTLSLNILDMNVPNLSLIEIDFASVIAQKVDLFLKVPIITAALQLESPSGSDSGRGQRSDSVFEESAGEGGGSLSPICEGDCEEEGGRTPSPARHHEGGSPTQRKNRGGRKASMFDKENFRTENGFRLGPLTLLSADLRSDDAVRNVLLASGVDPSIPTLFISECVLVYVDKQSVLSLCSSLASSFPQSAWVTYDMMNPHDRFGKTMLHNLQSARHNVPGFTDFPSKDHHERRFLESGWTSAACISMLSAYKRFISAEEASRIAKLEILDEIEEWELIMNHYALSLAINGDLLSPLLADFSS